MFSPLMFERLADDLSSLVPQSRSYYHTHPHQINLTLFKPSESSSLCGSSGVDKSQFQLMFNVKHFQPDEIEVKIVDNFVVIHGKHEEHADEHGFVAREFTRRYQLPDDVLPETVRSSLSQDGVLTIKAQKKLPEPVKNERVVPIVLQKSAVEEQRDAAKAQVQAEQEAMERAQQEKQQSEEN